MLDPVRRAIERGLQARGELIRVNSWKAGKRLSWGLNLCFCNARSYLV